MKILLVFVIISVALCYSQVKRFDNYRVYRITPKDTTVLAQLKQLQATNINYDFWSDVSTVNKPVDIMVSPQLDPTFQTIINLISPDVILLIEDVQKLIDGQRPNTDPQPVDFTNYNTYDEINQWLTMLANEYSSVTLIKGGQSYEGRNILGVHISFNPANENRAVFLEGGIHAREWVSVSTTMFQINTILKSTDPDIRAIADYHDWYVFPVINPDGYAYTFTTDRLWRKTRKPYLFGLCIGADPNRNWDYKWNQDSSITLPCSETYPGPKPFSEPETKSLSQYITSIAPKLIGYIGHHSYAQYLLLPYGDSNEKRDNYQELMDIGTKAVASLARKYGTTFQVGNVVDLLYVATGVSMDWVKSTHGVRLTYTYELRDTGTYGFLLPPNQIIPSGEEIVDALVTILTEWRARQ